MEKMRGISNELTMHYLDEVANSFGNSERGARLFSRCFCRAINELIRVSLRLVDSTLSTLGYGE